MNLSLCMAVFNEEKNLHYPLDSAYDLVDEVIIVDGGSTDKTTQIAKSYGNKVKIIQTDNPSMFHINKQKALEAAKGEWILQLDADEAITDELKQEIVKLLNGYTVKNSNLAIEQFNNLAFWVPRKNWFLNRFLMKGGQYPDYTIRLYRNGAVRFPCKDVHENVVISSKFKVQSAKLQSKVESEKNVIPAQAGIQVPDKIGKDISKIGYLKNPLLHYSDPTFARYWNRWKRYTKLEAKRFVETNNDSSNKPCFINYLFIKPIITFFQMYFRHKGFMDGWAGFVFAFFSSIRFIRIYFQYRKLKV